MDSRERVMLALRHKEPDRVPIHDFPWATTEKRWHEEGLPEGTNSADYFGFELAAISFDPSLRLPPETLEDTDEYLQVRNANGAIIRNWKYTTSTPEMIDFTIKSREAWMEHRPRTAWTRDRIDLDGTRKTVENSRAKGLFLTFSAPMGYDKTQGIVGSERLLMAMATDPDWCEDMFRVSVDMIVSAGEEMLGAGIDFDGAFLYDDMGYRNGSLFSPRMYRELLKPHHKRACDFFHAHGKPVILHSCGCVKGLIPDLIEAGFDCLQPLEVKAGMDLLELKKTYGDRLAFMGGIDARNMGHPDVSRIEEEIRTKVTAAKIGGGYLFHSDHSVPDNVSFQRYQHIVELVKRHGACK